MSVKQYSAQRRYHILSLKSFRDLGMGTQHWIVRMHRDSLSYMRHQKYAEA